MHSYFYDWHFAENSTCPWGYFRCESGQCVHLFGKCDEYEDCNDGSDERRCSEIKFAMCLIASHFSSNISISIIYIYMI